MYIQEIPQQLPNFFENIYVIDLNISETEQNHNNNELHLIYQKLPSGDHDIPFSWSHPDTFSTRFLLKRSL